jgi:NACalpha-BTF3-like transcription factor
MYAMEINKKVFGQHISGMRTLASAKELRKIADIEKIIIKAIENKWIVNEPQLIQFIQKY